MSDSTVQITPTEREVDGLTIRYAETEGVEDETILLLNPWPESLFAWNTIWSRLAKAARLVAIDLPGFGQSERRAELMSPQAMGEFLLLLIDEWDLGHPHVVGPDVGTGAVLFAAAEDVDRFPSAVVGSGGASFPLEVTGTLKQIIEAPDLSGFQGIDGRDIVAGALEGIERHTLPEAVREDYVTSYAGERFVESAAYVRRYPSDLRVLADDSATSRPLFRSSPAATTRSFRRATRSSCTRGCLTASSTSSRPAISRGRTAPTTIWI
jgi:pimeloyl-ACP methyl ester carboxylesterase